MSEPLNSACSKLTIRTIGNALKMHAITSSTDVSVNRRGQCELNFVDGTKTVCTSKVNSQEALASLVLRHLFNKNSSFFQPSGSIPRADCTSHEYFSGGFPLTK